LIFYSRTKASFVTSIVKVFNNSDIGILPYGQVYLAVVISTGGTTTLALQSIAISYIHRKVQANDIIKQLKDVDSKV
jgi:hypothetical protein